MGLYSLISMVLFAYLLMAPFAKADDPAKPTICPNPTEWKSVDAKAQPQGDCEMLTFDPITVTDFAATAGKDLSTALRKFHLEKFAATLENVPIVGQAFQPGDQRLDTAVKRTITPKIRAGFIPEADEANCKGNILYLEGLSDSMANHLPLFKLLSGAGYRVIAFDYLGQGGSRADGQSADDVRVEDVPVIAEQVYKRYATNAKCTKKILLGWSTGGLISYYWAADRKTDEKSIERQLKALVESARKAGKFKVGSQYLQKALDKSVDYVIDTVVAQIQQRIQIPSLLPGPDVSSDNIDAVVLLAPALAVRTVPGDPKALDPNDKSGSLFTFTDITPDMFTPDADQQKLYVDPVYPERVIDAPVLASDILLNSYLARAVYNYPVEEKTIKVPGLGKTYSLQSIIGSQIRFAAWTVPDRIKGLVFTTSDDDRFIDTQALLKESKDIAPGFEWVSVANDGPKIDPPARHGLDNERPDISKFVDDKILSFLGSLK